MDPSCKQNLVPSSQSMALVAKKRIRQSISTSSVPKLKKNKENVLAIVEKEISETCNETMKRAKYTPLERAMELQSKLASNFPSFVKRMLRSHVTGCFWLGLPKSFCDAHMPKQDEKMVLVDEWEEKSETKYLSEKTGLSGGWRGFSIAHKLQEEDVLVFQLIQPQIFKVYIVRANDLTEIDGAIGLLTLDPCSAKPLKMDHSQNPFRTCTKDDLELGTHEEMAIDILNNSGQSGDDSDEFGSEVMDGITFSQSVADIKDVKCIEDFKILVDGLIIDSIMPPYIRTKYYNLCCSQKSYLHENVIKGLNLKLVVGVMSETVNIADAIRACKISNNSCRDDIMIWDKTLKAFEDLGMTVGFLRERISKLMEILMCESKEVKMEVKRVEKEKAEEEMRSLERSLVNVKKVITSIEAQVEALKGVKGTEVLFGEEANAPW